MKSRMLNTEWPRFNAFYFMLICFTTFMAYETTLAAQTSKRLYLVLIDETDSFGLYKGKGVVDTLYWQEAIRLTRSIIGRLEPSDEFALIGIDEQGFDEEDVRIPFEELDEGFLRAKMQQSGLARKLMALQRRKNKHRSTDILGALYQAAHFAANEPDHETIIFCFSDMKQEPQWPSAEDAKNLKFPAGTKGFFFYVDASGRKNYDKIVSVWEPVLRHAGLGIYNGQVLSFFQQGNSNLKLNKILQGL